MMLALGEETRGSAATFFDDAATETVLAVACGARGEETDVACLSSDRVTLVRVDGTNTPTSLCSERLPDRSERPVGGCVAARGGRVAALRRFRDGGAEAAFFAAEGASLRRVASGKKTRGRAPRWLCEAPGEGVVVVTRCGALVELSWRGAAPADPKAGATRVVPAAVGTELEVYDACSCAGGLVAAVVRQMSDGHLNEGAFVALLEPAPTRGDSTSLQRECSPRAYSRKGVHASRARRGMIARPKISRNEWKRPRSEPSKSGTLSLPRLEPALGRRRRACRDASLGFGPAVGVALEASGAHVVVADGALGPGARVAWAPAGRALCYGSGARWVALDARGRGVLARGASAAAVAGLAWCGGGAACAVVDAAGGVACVPFVVASRGAVFLGAGAAVVANCGGPWSKLAVRGLGVGAAPTSAARRAHRLAVGGPGGGAVVDLDAGDWWPFCRGSRVDDALWLGDALLLAAADRGLELYDVEHGCRRLPLDGRLPETPARLLACGRDGDAYRVAAAGAAGLSAFVVRAGRTVGDEDPFYVVAPGDFAPGKADVDVVAAAWATRAGDGAAVLAVLDGRGGVAATAGAGSWDPIAADVDALATRPGFGGVLVVSGGRAAAWAPGLDGPVGARPAAPRAVDDLGPAAWVAGGDGAGAFVRVVAARRGNVHEPAARRDARAPLAAVVDSCVGRCAGRYAASLDGEEADACEYAYDAFAAAPDPAADVDLRRARDALRAADAADGANALAAAVAAAAREASRGDGRRAFASRCYLWLAGDALGGAGLLRVACRAARPLEPPELDALFAGGAERAAAAFADGRLARPRALFAAALKADELATAAELLPLVSAAAVDDAVGDGDVCRATMLAAAKALLWRCLGAPPEARPAPGDDGEPATATGLEDVWRFARRCEAAGGDAAALGRVDVTFCEWDEGGDDAGWTDGAGTDEVAARAVARLLAAASPASVRRAAELCAALRAVDAAWPGRAAAASVVVKIHHRPGETRAAVADHVLDALSLALRVVPGAGEPASAEDEALAAALLAFVGAYRLDDWRLPLALALGDDAAASSHPKLAEAFHDALIRRGAAGPLKDRVDLMRVRDANARHLAFVA